MSNTGEYTVEYKGKIWTKSDVQALREKRKALKAELAANYRYADMPSIAEEWASKQPEVMEISADLKALHKAKRDQNA